jgi:hypothetical protein
LVWSALGWQAVISGWTIDVPRAGLAAEVSSITNWDASGAFDDAVIIDNTRGTKYRRQWNTLVIVQSVVARITFNNNASWDFFT